ncbi:hypothetical protein B0O80DRAFT_292378 [Mortierella sp. GBAus27b]|nr:hypothetical protein B0O80DRAFT_292378 [Mortierella sp. GBAus27b]
MTSLMCLPRHLSKKQFTSLSSAHFKVMHTRVHCFPSLSGDLRADIKKITDRFFTPGSPASAFLDAYVRGEKALPVTTTGIKGLPKVLRRGVVDSKDSGPSLLFLDLPSPPLNAGDPIPERFRSNVLLSKLESMQAQDLPVFGVSGCGKTRSMIEMLCLQWGFYFNAAKSDLGSGDLSQLADVIDKKTAEEQGPEKNTAFARNMTLVLFLSRLLVLKYCLRVPNCRQTFSSARWAILQVCPHMLEDVFLDLFKVLFKRLNERSLFELVLTTVIQDEFLLVCDLLTGHRYPNFLAGSKLRLVVDEAQILSDKGSTNFRSSYLEIDPRPMLSPVLNGFRNAGGPMELTIVYCGTGLSIKTLHWALSSGDGVKEYGSSTFPYIEFPGWTGVDSVQAYVDHLKEQLQDDESKRQVDILLPSAAVDMLHQRLTGRFRPIVTAIEGIIKTGVPDTWENVIDITETMITSWKERERRGNLCGELKRLESKMVEHPNLFKNVTSIRNTLALFLFRYNLLDATEIVLENEAHLIEAAFGRIKLFGGVARTVLDEPFVLKAVKAFFHESDPLLLADAERALLHSINASVHGNMWETCMPPVFIETFKNRPLSSWPLLANNTLPESLVGDVTIVGYTDQQSKLAISHNNITTHAFMEAHVKNGSKREDEDIPPFYFPVPHVSGPDLVFYIKIQGNVIPVFVQLKLRQVLEGSDVEKALATVSSNTIQSKMDKEHEKLVKDPAREHKMANRTGTTQPQQPQQPPRLQDYCPTGVYVSMAITYPAEVIKFQVFRPDPEPELEGLERVSINIDDNNFPQIFPERHVKFLDRLKQHKRSATEEPVMNPPKKVKNSSYEISNGSFTKG